MVGMYIISATILQILEDTESSGKEELHGLTPDPQRAKDANVQRGDPDTSPAEKVYSRTVSSRKASASRLRITELRNLRYVKYGATAVLCVCVTIVTPLSYSYIELRNTLEGVIFIGVMMAMVAVSFSTYSVFKHYSMLLKLLDDEVSSNVKDHLKASMR
jgi:hypothetical protein